MFCKILEAANRAVPFSYNSQEITCARVSFSIKLQAPPTTLLKKETLVQVFFCELCEVFKVTFFTEHLRETASAPGVMFFGKLKVELASLDKILCNNNY